MTTSQLLDICTLCLSSVSLFWLTGRLCVRVLNLRLSHDILTRVAIEIGLGLAFWPLLLLFTDLFGLRWSPAVGRFSALLVCVASFVDFVWVPGTTWQRRQRRLRKEFKWLSVFGIIFILTFVTRCLHIRDLALPPWIDSVHHTMVVRLLVERGALPETYAPFIVGGRFFYHWGYHALVAWLAWFLDRTEAFAIAQLVLHFGQVLNTLAVLMLYAAGRVLFDSRRAGLLAALITGLVSWFPAYYVTWGRYTQLAGLLVLIPFLIMLWDIRSRPTYARMGGAALLGAGLFLIHIRVFIFAGTFISALIIFLLLGRDWRTLGRWALIGLVIVLLILPWLRVLVNYQQERSSILVSNSPSKIEEFNQNYNIVQKDLLWAPRNRQLLSIATAGITGILGWGAAPLWERVLSFLWLSALGYLLVRKRGSFPGRLGRALGLLTLWCLLTVLLLNLHLLGLPNIGIIHNNSALIALFVPLALSVGGLSAWILKEVCPGRWAWLSMLCLVSSVALWGTFTMTDVVNPTTVLAKSADVEAMYWIRENTSAEARFAVNIWPWLGQAYAGSDGGYWIPVLTDRFSVLLPALYTSALPRADVLRVNQTLTAWYHVQQMDDQMLRRWLQENDITHVYIGANGGLVSPQRFLDLSFARTVYQQEGVFIFEIDGL